jgi:hypothetical protein
MTRHQTYNLCILALQAFFALLFRFLDMPNLVMIANLTGLSLIMLALVSMVVPKWREWWIKTI